MVWVVRLWVVAGCVGFDWVVVGLLMVIIDVGGLLRWICGGGGCDWRKRGRRREREKMMKNKKNKEILFK